MTLEQYFNNEKLNVKNLSLEVPATRRGDSFDIDSHLGWKKWNSVRNFLFEKKENFESFLAACAEVKIAFSDKVRELGINIDHRSFLKNLIEERGDLARKGSVPRVEEQLLGVLFSAKVLFPQESPEIAYMMRPGSQERHVVASRIKDIYGKAISLSTGEVRREFVHFIDMLSKAMIIMPDFSLDEVLSSFRKEKLWEQVQRFLDRSRIWKEWDNFTRTAASARILFSEEFREPEVVSLQDWENMTGSSMMKDDADYHSIRYIANLKILAAKDIMVSENGLELIFPERKLAEGTQVPVPESRKF